MALTPDGKTAYVNAYAGVIPIDLVTMRAEHKIDMDGLITAIAVAPDGKAAYIGEYSGKIYSIDVATNHVGKSISAGSSIQYMAISS